MTAPHERMRARRVVGGLAMFAIEGLIVLGLVVVAVIISSVVLSLL